MSNKWTEAFVWLKMYRLSQRSWSHLISPHCKIPQQLKRLSKSSDIMQEEAQCVIKHCTCAGQCSPLGRATFPTNLESVCTFSNFQNISFFPVCACVSLCLCGVNMRTRHCRLCLYYLSRSRFLSQRKEEGRGRKATLCQSNKDKYSENELKGCVLSCALLRFQALA